ncbi:SOS response-associated peptidase [Donghicola tyrosinivorans]|uniref:Abasic site processing protein n=1 Tax=Donghicola tyrosinivorans TaxID=1652492 RepID=A0A2T0X0Q2_9RHOB|nr:SOS response-associated peptidase [Donghicola tyrosinivorans]PRY92526.1 putative SOS response-associated peptidase YedK [Donghicola tyrosinivorans]
MCGRFSITIPEEAMAQIFDALPANDLPETPNYNVCPTNDVAVVLAGERRRLVSMRWGFIPKWYNAPNDGPLLINARAETIAQKPAFREACRQRRCILPVSGFYEWTKTPDGKRLPWYIFRTDGAPMAFAGVWQEWEGPEGPTRTCAIVTCAANEGMSTIHHRMPVVLEPENFGLWLGEEGHGAAPLMRPAAEEVLRWYRVDPAVNSNRAEGPELIEPIP